MAKAIRTIIMSHHASPSSPSVILIALTILMVTKNVNMGASIPILILPASGRKLI